MNNKVKLLPLAVILSIGLIGCNDQTDNGNGNGTPSQELPTISVDDSLAILNQAIIKETLKASEAHVDQIDQSGNIYNVKKDVHHYYNDYTSSLSGEYLKKETKNNNEEVIDQSNYNQTRKLVVDKVNVDGVTSQHNMYVNVLDYENDNLDGNHQDQASRVYIMANDNVAHSNGLEEGQYVTAEQFQIELSRKVAVDLKDFVITNVIANPYLATVGNKKFYINTLENGDKQYHHHTEYNYNGDMNNTIFTTIDIDFTVDEEFKLLFCNYFMEAKDVNKDDENDFYTSKVSTSANVEYAARNAAGEGLLDPDQYFVSNIGDVEFLNGQTVLDENDITSDMQYLRVRAKNVTPSKAVSKDIYCESSSDESVIKLDANHALEVLKDGTTNLTFKYMGKDSAGTYVMKTLIKKVVVKVPHVKSIEIGYNKNFENNTITKGQAVKLDVLIKPKEALQTYQAVSEKDYIASVEVMENGQLLITAKEKGKTNVTLTSLENSEVKYVFEVNVYDPNFNYKDVIVNKTYYHDRRIFNADIYLKFNEDNTGLLTLQTVLSEYDETLKKTVYTPIEEYERFTFTYTLQGNKIFITYEESETMGATRHIDEGVVLNEQGTALHMDNNVTCASYDFNVINK